MNSELRIEQELRPFHLSPDASLELHLLTSSHHAVLAVWALASWYGVGRRSDQLCIHDDGSLRSTDCDRFKRLFPGCRIVLREEADIHAQQRLARYPALQKFRSGNNLALKALDFFFFAKTQKIILMDSDVLTFRLMDHVDVLARSPANVFLKDYQHAFNLTGEQFDLFSASNGYLPINSGFGIVDIRTLDLDLASEVIENSDPTVRPFWAEQTLYAILSARIGILFFDDSHIVARKPGIDSNLTLKHYVWNTRSLFESEGVEAILKILRVAR